MNFGLRQVKLCMDFRDSWKSAFVQTNRRYLSEIRAKEIINNSSTSQLRQPIKDMT